MSLHETAKQAEKARVERTFTVTQLHDGVRELSGLGLTPEDAWGLHPGVGFLIRTGLFPPEAPLSALTAEFSGGSSRFAAHDAPQEE